MHMHPASLFYLVRAGASRWYNPAIFNQCLGCNMLTVLVNLVKQNLRGILRDRMLHAVLGVGLAMLLLVPSLSTFSMRQVQELAVTLSLSAISAVLLVVTLLLGSSSVWRDIEKRYTASVLTLPIPRAAFLLGKFCSLACFLLACGVILGLFAALVIALAAAQYPSPEPVAWGNIAVCIGTAILKYVLLGSLALLLSSLSTSFFLPFFGTVAIFFAGSASQEVYEYVTGAFGEKIHPLSVGAIKGTYYLLPNFAAFDYQVHAVYGLPLPTAGLGLTFLYWLVYTGLLLGLAIWTFNRRQLP